MRYYIAIVNQFGRFESSWRTASRETIERERACLDHLSKHPDEAASFSLIDQVFGQELFFPREVLRNSVFILVVQEEPAKK